MSYPIDVVAIGELLIDFTDYGTSSQGNRLLEENPGGAPCNVLAMLHSLGRRTAFIGKVGDDQFGHMLKATLEEIGIDTKGLYMDQDIHTTLAFVKNSQEGDRDFAFYRKPGADMMLNPDEINNELINRANIFHYGSLSLTDEPVRSATKKAIEYARNRGILLSCDPNLREQLWDNLSEAETQIEYACSQCDILKISDNELEFIFGTSDIKKSIEYLKAEYPQIKLISITMGKEGSIILYKDIQVYQEAFLTDKTIDTTGAGDTFCACMIDAVIKYGIDGLDEVKIIESAKRASKAASLITERHGALRVMPKKEEIGCI